MSSQEYDVIIVGGGFAGIGAAIGARQTLPSGRILLLESEAFLGGAGTHRGVYSLCGLYTCTAEPKRTVGAIWDVLREPLLAVGATRDKATRHRGVFQIFDPEGMKLVLDDLMDEYNIQVLLHSTVVNATRSGNHGLYSCTIQERSRTSTFVGKAFVDCSGDGDLAFHGGASVRYGNHGTVNLGSLATRFGGLQSAKPSAELWKQAILKAKEANPALKHIIPKNASVQLRLPGSGDITTYLASASYDARDPKSITAAEKQGRRQALEYIKILRQLPGHENMYLACSGPNFGTRESRHINARYQLQYEDIEEKIHFDDVVAICGWGSEWHDQHDPDWASTFTLPPKEVFEIPFRSLCSVNTPNLFTAGRCLDADRRAGSAARVMGTALALGQAAGVGAALYARDASFPNVVEVQEILLKNGALLDVNALPGPVQVEQANVPLAKANQVHPSPVETDQARL